MGQHKNLTTKLNILIDDVPSNTSLIGLRGFNFSKRIAGKHTFFRKSANLPALILLRLFGTRIVNKITNISRTELINNYFRLNLNNYFKAINQLKQVAAYCHQSKESGYYFNYSKINLQPMAGILALHQNLYLRAESVASKNETLPLSPIITKGILLRLLSNPAMSEDRNLKAAEDKNIYKPAEGILAGHSPLAINETNRSQRFTKVHENSHPPLDPLPSREGREIVPSPLVGDGQGEGVFSGQKLNKQKINDLILLGYTSAFPDMIYPVQGDNLPRKGPKVLRGLHHSKSSDLIFRKPTMQSDNAVLANKQDLQTPKTISSKTSNDMAKDFFKKVPMTDINSIADRVYKIIEKKIYIEKDRRGL